MSPEAVALLILFGMLSITGIGFAVDKYDKKRKAKLLRKQGAANVSDAKLEVEMHCKKCGDPVAMGQGDLFIIDPDEVNHGAWWHRKCWKELNK